MPLATTVAQITHFAMDTSGYVYALDAAKPEARAAAAAAGSPTLRAAASASNERVRSSAVRFPPRANTWIPSIAARSGI